MKLKLRSSVRFLASIFNGVGTKVRKDGLATYVDLDYSALAQIATFNSSQKLIAIFDAITGVWNTTTVGSLFSGSGYAGTSTTSLAIAAVPVTLQTQPSLSYLPGTRARLSSAANTSNYMEGIVTAYSLNNLSINIARINGSGTFADWNLSLAGDPGAGDMLSTNNGSDFANKTTTRVNLGFADGIPASGWKVANLRADNVPSFRTVAMDMTADYAILYNPVSGDTKRIVGSALTQQPGISSAGPASGGRDRAAGFATGNVVWFYYIWGATPGVGSITSLTAPTATNGGGTMGPVLPSGYTHYCPCFPLPLVGSVTLLPLIPQGGSTEFQVRGDTVSYPNIPEMIGVGYPTQSFNLSAWAPPSVALLTKIMLDVEIHSSGSGGVIGGAVPSTSLGNFGNVSLYPPVASSWYADDPTFELPLPGGLMTITFLSSAGVIDQAIGEVWIRGYTFSNGG